MGHRATQRRRWSTILSAENGAGTRSKVSSIALVSSNALSLTNFRGPLIKAMVGAGAKVWALAPDYTEAQRAKLRELGANPVDISLNRTGMHPLRDLMDTVRLARLLRRLSPDAVLGYFIKPVIYGSIAAWLARVPRRFALVAGMGYVFTPAGDRESFGRRALRVAVSFLYRLGFAACELVFFHNEDDRTQVVEAGLVQRSKTILIAGTGVDLQHFRAAPLGPEPTRFLLIARLLREKGIYEFVDAARIVKQTYPDTEFHLVGGLDSNPGGLTAEVVHGWANEGLLTWSGHVDDVRDAIAGCHVFVLPSYREGKPRSTQEALACGRAVVTTDVPGCRDTVLDGINGFLVPARDADALANAFINFVNNPDLAREMGARSRLMAEERFDIHRINSFLTASLGIRTPAARESAGAKGLQGSLQ